MFDIDRSNWDTSAGVTGLKSESTSPLWGRSKSKGVGLPCNFRAIESLRETIVWMTRSMNLEMNDELYIGR